MLFFARRLWALVTVSIAVGLLFLAVAIWLITYIQLNPLPGYQTGIVLLTGVVMGLILWPVVRWIEKYFYFFKLRRLLDSHVESEYGTEYVMADGTRYVVRGRSPHYTITVLPNANSDTVCVYNIGDTCVSTVTHKSFTRVESSGANFGECEFIEIRPLLFDQRRTFKRLSRVLDQVSLI